MIEDLYSINWDERELGIVKNKDFGYKIQILERAIIRAYTVIKIIFLKVVNKGTWFVN